MMMSALDLLLMISDRALGASEGRKYGADS